MQHSIEMIGERSGWYTYFPSNATRNLRFQLVGELWVIFLTNLKNYVTVFTIFFSIV